MFNKCLLLSVTQKCKYLIQLIKIKDLSFNVRNFQSASLKLPEFCNLIQKVELNPGLRLKLRWHVQLKHKQQVYWQYVSFDKRHILFKGAFVWKLFFFPLETAFKHLKHKNIRKCMYLQLVKPLYSRCKFQSVNITGEWWLPVLRGFKKEQANSHSIFCTHSETDVAGRVFFFSFLEFLKDREK